MCLYPFILSETSRVIVRDALREQTRYLLAPPLLDRRPESLVSAAEHPDYGFIIKAISTSHFSRPGRSSLTYDTLAAARRPYRSNGVLRVFSRASRQMLAAINESAPHNFIRDFTAIRVSYMLPLSPVSCARDFTTKRESYI